jgi:hypothetical protein
MGGVDTHADTHEAAVLDGRRRLLAVTKFVTTDHGIREMLTWMRGFGRVQQVAVEGTGSYGAELTRQPRTAGINVIEVNQPHAHTRSRRGKTDAIDARSRRPQGTGRPVHSDTERHHRHPRGRRPATRGVPAQSKPAPQRSTSSDDLLVSAPGELRQKLTAKTLPGKASQCAQWQPEHDRLTEPVQAAHSAWVASPCASATSATRSGPVSVIYPPSSNASPPNPQARRHRAGTRRSNACQLRSADFYNSDEHPQLVLAVTQANATPDGGFAMVGTLERPASKNRSASPPTWSTPATMPSRCGPSWPSIDLGSG